MESYLGTVGFSCQSLALPLGRMSKIGSILKVQKDLNHLTNPIDLRYGGWNAVAKADLDPIATIKPSHERIEGISRI